MAITFWTGAVDGDLTDNANWTGSAPGAPDTGIFNAGDVDVDPALGQIAQVTSLLVYSGYTGNIGGSGNEMIMGAGILKFFGGSGFWWKDGGTTTDVYIRAAAAPVPDGPVINLGGDTAANIHCMRGDIVIAGDMGNMVLLTVGMKDNPTTDVALNIVSGAGTITAYRQFGGTVDAAAPMVTCEVANGIFTLTGAVAITGALSVSGGQCNHDSTGTIADMLLHGGRTDLGSTDKTITKSAIFPGATLVTDLGLHTYTVPLQDLRENVSGS